MRYACVCLCVLRERETERASVALISSQPVESSRCCSIQKECRQSQTRDRGRGTQVRERGEGVKESEKSGRKKKRKRRGRCREGESDRLVHYQLCDQKTEETPATQPKVFGQPCFPPFCCCPHTFADLADNNL